LEVECLKVLWSIGKASVREVRAELLTRHRELAYTTVMTVLDRLSKRGAATRKKASRRFVYEAVLTREALRAMAVKELVELLFDGAAADLSAYLRNEFEDAADSSSAS